jgi:hypothetical protein
VTHLNPCQHPIQDWIITAAHRAKSEHQSHPQMQHRAQSLDYTRWANLRDAAATLN